MINRYKQQRLVDHITVMYASYLEFKILNLLQHCSLQQLKQIHVFITTTSLNQNIHILSKFLRRTTEFGGMDYPELIFSQMGHKIQTEIYLWNAMIRGYAYNGPYLKCISMYDEMIQRGLQPNNYTYPYVLNSCTEMGNHKEGKKVHCRIIKTGFGFADSVANSVLSFHIKMFDCFKPDVMKNEKLSIAQKVFDDMLIKPVEFWNRLISEYVNFGDLECARKLFEEMPERDIVSWNSMVSGYAGVGDLENARDLFERMPEKNVVSWTSMLGAFASSGDLQMARKLFENMPDRNVVSWNSMISNYVQHEKFDEALDLFTRMLMEGVDLDGFTFVSALSACSHLGALEFGKWIHFHLMRDWSQLGVIVGTALIEMYANCGDVERAFKVFIKICKKDVFCWNVMIKSLAIHGRIEDAIKIFFMMQKRGLKPNDFTFTNALFACNHGGLVDEGHRIFYSIERDFGVNPKIEHYGCLIDLLGRNGQLEEAHLLVKVMPYKADIAIWGALLGGCRVRGDIKLAEKVMERIDELKTNANESGVYVLLSNIYASANQWPKAVSARDKMEENRIWKKAGCSSVLEGVYVGV